RTGVRAGAAPPAGASPAPASSALRLPGRSLPPQRLRDLRGCLAQLARLLVVAAEALEELDRRAVRGAVPERDDCQPPHRLVAVACGQLVQERPDAVDDARVIARKPLDREQGGAAAGGALVLEPATEQLGLLPEPELSDRAERDRAVAVVVRARCVLELLVPLLAEHRQRALVACLRQCVRFGSGLGERHAVARLWAGGPT